MKAVPNNLRASNASGAAPGHRSVTTPLEIKNTLFLRSAGLPNDLCEKVPLRRAVLIWKKLCYGETEVRRASTTETPYAGGATPTAMRVPKKARKRDGDTLRHANATFCPQNFRTEGTRV